MARLPVVGSDEGSWGSVLNSFLGVAHNGDGTLKTISYASLSNKPDVDNPTLLIASDAPSAWQTAAGTKLDGTDDAGALETAINAGPVVLSPGTFTLNATITVTAENPVVLGSGWSTVVKIADGMDDWAMLFTPATGDGVRGTFARFTLDGNSSNQAGGGGIHARGAVQSVFSDVHFLNCYTAGLWLDAFPDAAFGHHNKVVSCLFDATIASAGSGLGLLINSCDENYIRSEFQFLGGTGSYAVRDLAGLNLFQASVFVGGRNNMGGIELRDGQRSRVANCTFDGVSGNNVFVASSSAHVITGNVFTSVADQASSNGTYSGIYFEFAVTECIATENVLETSSTAGRTRSLIREDGSGGTGVNIVKNNVIRQNGAGTPSVGFTDMNGAGSLVTDNAIDGTIA